MKLDEIPSISKIVQAYRPSDDEDYRRSYTELGQEKPFYKLLLALMDGEYSTARKIMQENGWNAHSCTGSDNRSLIYLACWGNSGSVPHGLSARLYYFLVQEDPDCIAGDTPHGGSYLHLLLQQSAFRGMEKLALAKDLLDRGNNFLQRDETGRTVFDWIQQQRDSQSGSPEYLDALEELVRQKQRSFQYSSALNPPSVPPGLIGQETHAPTQGSSPSRF